MSQATLHQKLGQMDAAIKLLKKAARAEPKVEEAYLKPLLAELAGQAQQAEAGDQQPQEQQDAAAAAAAAAAAREQLQEGTPEAEAPAARRQGEK